MTTNNAPKRALIVIDVQNEYFTGGLPIEYPDPQQTVATSVPPWMRHARRAFR